MKTLGTNRKEKKLIYNRKFRLLRFELLSKFKDVPCKDCGIKYPPCAMDFDHKDPILKFKRVGALVGHSINILKREISKCDVVCSNCHRIRTARQRLEGMFSNDFGVSRNLENFSKQLSLKFDKKEKQNDGRRNVERNQTV